MVNYKRLTEIDTQMKAVRSFIKDIKHPKCELTMTIKTTELESTFGDGDITNLLKETLYTLAIQKVNELQREKIRLLNKQWWEFWKN